MAKSLETAKKTPVTTDVLIGGRIYSLSGADSEYLQKVAALLNAKIAEVRSTPGYKKLDQEYKELLLNLNLADEYFKLRKEAEGAKDQAAAMENELYTARHDLVSQKLKLENALKQQDVLEKRIEDFKAQAKEARSQADKAVAEAEAAKARAEELSSGGEDLSAQLEDEKAQAAEVKAQYEGLKMQYDALKAEHEAAHTELEETHTALDEANAKIAELTASCEDWKEKAEKAQEEAEEWRALAE